MQYKDMLAMEYSTYHHNGNSHVSRHHNAEESGKEANQFLFFFSKITSVPNETLQRL